MAGGNDTYVVSLLPMDGDDASTDFPDIATGGTHTWTARGTAQVDTAQSKFGGASLLLDGNSDWIDTPTSTDFSFAAGDFTIDFWIRFASTAAQQGIMGSHVDSNDLFQIWFFGNTDTFNYKWLFYWKDGSTVRANYVTTDVQSDPGTTNWHHVAFVRNGANFYFFLDGTSIALTVGTACGTLTNINSVYQIGAAKTAAGAQTYANGWIEESRICKGVARWTENFTPPTEAYSSLITMDADAGSFAITGTAATFDIISPVAAGSFALTGTDAALLAAYQTACATGSIALTGQDASLLAAYQTACAAGGFSLTGTDAQLLYAAVMGADSGAISLTGFAASLLLENGGISAEGGSINLTGHLLEFILSYKAAQDFGFPSLGKAIPISGESGSYAFNVGGDKVISRGDSASKSDQIRFDPLLN